MQEESKKVNYWKIAFVIFALVIILSGSYLFYRYSITTYYNKGYSDGTFYTAQTGMIRYMQNDTIQQISLKDVCSGGNNG